MYKYNFREVENNYFRTLAEPNVVKSFNNFAKVSCTYPSKYYDPNREVLKNYYEVCNYTDGTVPKKKEPADSKDEQRRVLTPECNLYKDPIQFATPEYYGNKATETWHACYDNNSQYFYQTNNPDPAYPLNKYEKHCDAQIAKTHGVCKDVADNYKYMVRNPNASYKEDKYTTYYITP